MTPRDLRADASRPQRPTVAVEVIATIGDQQHRPPPGSAALASHRWDRIHQR
jgi:hypothetical protein